MRRVFFNSLYYIFRMRVSQSIGDTPLLKISERLYVKFETLNPSGSIRDRMACFILDSAEKNGYIQSGGVIVEATSGNTGIAFSMLAAERGYRMIVVMPCDMSEERKKMIRAFGAEIVEVGASDFIGALAKRDELVRDLNAFCPQQFSNKENVECHKHTTGQEILQQVSELTEENKNIAAFVAGVGTGGTIMGVREALKEIYPEVRIVGVEPSESAVMSGGEPGCHTVQGIGDGFIPDIVNMEYIDEIITVPAREAEKRAESLAKKEGILVGISAGANVCASEKYIERYQPQGLVITILCDRGERYLSMM